MAIPPKSREIGRNGLPQACPAHAPGTSPLVPVVIISEIQRSICAINGILENERSIPSMYLLLSALVCQHSVFSKALN